MKYLLLLFAPVLLWSCGKDYAEDCPNDLKKEKFKDEFSTIVIESGNGDIYIRKGDDFMYEYPGGWIEDEGHNEFWIENDELHIRSSFSESYVTLPDLAGIHVLSDNSTTFIGKAHGRGEKTFEIFENATILFGEVCGDEEVLTKSTSDLYVDAIIHSNGTIDLYELELQSLEIDYREYGTFRVNVSNSLSGTIYDNGKLYYKGNPSINVNVMGDGEIINDN